MVADDAIVGSRWSHSFIRRCLSVFLASVPKIHRTLAPVWVCLVNTIWRATWALRSMPEPTRTTLKARIADASAASHRFLAQAQNTDGGWGYRPGDASDTSSTCYSLLALAAMDRCPQEDPVVRAGIAHLLSRQEPNSTFTALPDQVAPRPLLFDAPVFTDIWVLLALAGFDSDETR